MFAKHKLQHLAPSRGSSSSRGGGLKFCSHLPLSNPSPPQDKQKTTQVIQHQLNKATAFIFLNEKTPTLQEPLGNI